MEIEVRGHSGCQIDIVREANNLVLYKSTADTKYYPRLVKQAEKQKIAGELEYQHIRVPQILSVEEQKNVLLVRMEYIYSRNFIEYFESAGFEQINYLIKALKLFLEKELAASPAQKVEARIIKDKFADVKSKVLNNPLLNEDVEIKEILRLSDSIFEKCEDMIMPIVRCHGDLTFSNILFNGNNYFLIDFLDSFVESPLLDIVKIRQDSAYLWSALMYTKPYDAIRLKIISKKIDGEIDNYFQKYDWYTKYYGIYQLMNFWRVLQYCKEPRIARYLKKVLLSILAEKQLF